MKWLRYRSDDLDRAIAESANEKAFESLTPLPGKDKILALTLWESILAVLG